MLYFYIKKKIKKKVFKSDGDDEQPEDVKTFADLCLKEMDEMTQAIDFLQVSFFLKKKKKNITFELFLRKTKKKAKIGYSYWSAI